MKINVILFGATGMVGEGILHEALHHADIESVLVIGRRSCNVKHEKLKELIHNDFFNYSGIEEYLKGYQACFFCLGVSAIGMSEQEYSRVTYDLTMQAAHTLSKLNPEMTFCYVSGAGTDSTEQGHLIWARVKGKTENDLAKLAFRAIYLFRPGFIKPTKGLRNAYSISKVIGQFYPVWKVLFPNYVCTLEELGLAMIYAVKKGYPKQILKNKDICSLAQSERSGSV